jgi:hypothetical protein
MKRIGKVQIGAVIVGALVAAWQSGQHRQSAGELATFEAEAQAESQKIEARQDTLAALQQRSSELVEAERRAGNETLLSLMRERAAAAAVARSNSAAAAESKGVGGTLAKVLDNSGQQEVERESIRNKTRSGMGLFFKLVHLTPEKTDQYIDLEVERESGKARRTAALLRGDMAFADAQRERDNDKQELESQQRDLLGAEGTKFLDSIADGMRNDEAKRLANGIQEAMGEDALNDQQREKLQGLIKTEIVMLPLDDTDLFRTPDEWAQIVSEHQQNVLRAAGDFLNATQLETLRNLAALDLAARQQQMIQRRKTLGIR